MGISGKMSLRKSSSDPSSSHLAVMPNCEAENLLPSVVCTYVHLVYLFLVGEQKGGRQTFFPTTPLW